MFDWSNIPGIEDLDSKVSGQIKSGRLAQTLLLLGLPGGNQLAFAIRIAQQIILHHTKADKINSANSKLQQLIHPDVHFSFPVVGSKKVSDEFLTEFREAVVQQPFLEMEDWLAALNAENKLPNITKEETHKIIGKLGLKPFESKARVVILWLPEYLGNSGNALLKILEEPPHNTFFILVANSTEKILNTILSRCQIIRLPILSPENIIQFASHFHPEQLDQITDIAYSVDGNINLALKQVQSNTQPHTDICRAWLLTCYSQKSGQMITASEEIAAMKKDKIIYFLQTAMSILREAAAVYHVPENRIKFPSKYHDFIVKLSKVIDFGQVDEIYNQLNKSCYYIERNANAKIAMLNLSLKMRHFFLR